MSPFLLNHGSIPTAAIIVIGDEILSGRTKDKNIGWLADQLSALGIQLGEARVIADKKNIIIDTVQILSDAYDLVFTSGGIGPTHDDITTDAVAAAFDVPVIRHPEAERRLIAHYENTYLRVTLKSGIPFRAIVTYVYLVCPSPHGDSCNPQQFLTGLLLIMFFNVLGDQ